MTDICYDTEFLEDGRTIELISIGLVIRGPTQNTTYYAVNADCDINRVYRHPWLRDNVVPSLPIKTSIPSIEGVVGSLLGMSTAIELDTSDATVKPKWVIANEIRDLIQSVVDPKLWAYFGAYDHVVLAQLWGPMSKIPPGIPMWTHDLMQLWEENPSIQKPDHNGRIHNALDDAAWNWKFLQLLRKENR